MIKGLVTGGYRKAKNVNTKMKGWKQDPAQSQEADEKVNESVQKKKSSDQTLGQAMSSSSMAGHKKRRKDTKRNTETIKRKREEKTKSQGGAASSNFAVQPRDQEPEKAAEWQCTRCWNGLFCTWHRQGRCPFRQEGPRPKTNKEVEEMNEAQTVK